MKILHLADLHLGMRIYERSLLEDQRYILSQILDIVDEQRPQAVLLAGDIYDKAVPSAEAVVLLDDFLCSLQQRGCAVMMISGNHDSAERLSFGSRALTASGLYVAPVFDGTLNRVSLSDDYGEVNFYLLPFIKPAHVSAVYEDFTADSYTAAVGEVITRAAIDRSVRNVIVCHQFFTGAYNSDADVEVGGLDNVDAAVVADFDYAAAGHIHRPQAVGKNGRYSGTPLRYSFSEANQIKSATIVTLGSKGSVEIDAIPLAPLRELRELRGTLEQLTDLSFISQQRTEDYLHITLTDEQDQPDALSRLRSAYENLLLLDYDNARTRAQQRLIVDDGIKQKSPTELFFEFYRRQNNSEPSEQQKKIICDIAARVFEEEGL